MKNTLILGLALTCFAQAAYAIPYGARSTGHNLSVAGGIAAPSSTTSGFGENPAGLSYNLATAITGVVLSSSDDFSPLSLGGLITLGNGNMGASVSLLRSNSGNNLDLGLGASALIEPMSSQLGIAARKALKPSGGRFDFDLGLIVNPRGSTRFGLMVFGLEGGIDGYGGGVSLNPSQDVTFAVDASYEPHFKDVIVKPGLKLRASQLSLSVGYGIEATDGAAAVAPSIVEGFSAGFSWDFSSSAKLEFYHSQIDRWAGFLSFVF